MAVVGVEFELLETAGILGKIIVNEKNHSIKILFNANI